MSNDQKYKEARLPFTLIAGYYAHSMQQQYNREIMLTVIPPPAEGLAA